MRGHEPLIALRRQGLRPVMAQIEVSDIEPLCLRDWQHNAGIPVVHIEPTDSLSSLDLRFVVGLVVHVTGESESRVKAVFRACKAAEASRVWAGITRTQIVAGSPVGEVLELLDSEAQ